MKRIRTILFGALTILSLSAPLEAWDAVGHQVVAHIAWENMTPRAQERAVALLRAAPRDADLASLSADPHELFLLASTWPDIVRDSSKPERQARYHHSSWHYTNFFWEQPAPGSPPRDREDLKPAPVNAVERLGHLEKSLADPARSDAEKAVDLAWVLHLVGDIHQPLHASARVTPTEPEGDRGGNLFLLGGDDDLHWYWDSILGKIWLRRGLSDSKLAEKIADDFRRQYPKGALNGRLQDGQFERWAKEGLAKTKEEVYTPSLERGKKPSHEYRWQAYGTAKPALALAGYRLAAMLNGVLE